MKKTQGRRLIDILKLRKMTTMQLQMTGISTCPWKRIADGLEDGETLKIHKNRDGLNVYWVETKYVPKTVWVK